jgi:UDP-hydrolysing UDP-N-acetyl-D-glucosamine 2-epimerase
MRRIGAVTVARSDYGIYRPVLARIAADDELELRLYVAGSHLSHAQGLTLREIEADGFEIAMRIDALPQEDTPAAAARAFGETVSALAPVFADERPDVLLVLGDRYEMLAAAVAALPFALPLAHIHGGELTEAATDDAIRHALTKLSHLHFVATEEYARRVIQLGEEPWRVTVSGAPGLDNVLTLQLDGGPDVSEPFLLVTWHPVTLERNDAERQLGELLAALENAGIPIVFTHPNADPGRSAIAEAIERFAVTHEGTSVFVSLGTRDYFALMRRAAAMVGNSSSGIIEAASFELPVVNIGNRQHGRVRGPNVLDVAAESAEIETAIRRAGSAEFRASLHGLVNPYGDGQAAQRIVARLREVELGPDLLVKRFHEVA